MFEKYNYKAQFLAKRDGNKNIVNCFDNCAGFEEFRVNKDICEFTVEEFVALIEYLLNNKNLSPGTVEADVSYLRGYLRFCSNKTPLSLKEQDIKRVIKENGGDVKKWLSNFPTPDAVDYLLSYDELLSLENIENRISITNQMLAAVWLLFIGMRVEEIRYIEENDIDDWDKWYRNGVELPADIKNKVSSILSLAKEEVNIPREGIIEGRKQRTTCFKPSKYFFKKAYGKSEGEGEGEGKPIPALSLATYFDKIKEILSKKRLRQVNIRRSGMLYFGYLQFDKDNPIKTHFEMNSLIYKPICIMFDEDKTYEIELRKLFASSVLTTFYGLEPITQLYRIPNLQNSNEEAVYELTEQPPEPPQARKPTDPKPWVEKAKKGEHGELLVLSWIKDKRYDPVIHAKDSVGYDIYAKIENEIRCIEVKTMEKIPGDIYITRHEYEVAHSQSKYYWFYIVVLNDAEKNTPVVYTFKDLLSLLKLQDKEQELFTQSKYNIEYDSFSIRLDADVIEKCNQRIKLL